MTEKWTMYLLFMTSTALMADLTYIFYLLLLF